MTTNGEDPYRALQEAADIVDGLGFGEEEPSFREIRARARNLLALTYGPQWSKCSVAMHCTKDGEMIYSASVLCMACKSVHTYLFSVGEDGSIDFCNPVRPE